MSFWDECSEDAREVGREAKRIAASQAKGDPISLTLEALASALVQNEEGGRLLAHLLGMQNGGLAEHLPPQPGADWSVPDKCTPTPEAKSALKSAREERGRRGAPQVTVADLATAVAIHLPEGSIPGAKRVTLDEARKKLGEPGLHQPKLGEIARKLRHLRDKLRRDIKGQDEAIAQVIDGLFSGELSNALDPDRRRPAGIFTLAGPPGVGKTFLAESIAAGLGRPDDFKRFDMSEYTHVGDTTVLAGSAKVYQGSRRGTLTGFVKKHPKAILLFDEIEKANPAIHNLFLSILDAGRLTDEHSDETIDFRETLIFFTTNAGRSLYEDESNPGRRANRTTILDALRTELDSSTGRPLFPAAICSRMASGYPILFNHLAPDDLVAIAGKHINHVAEQLGEHFALDIEVHPRIPYDLLLREGRTDARTLRAKAESFVREAILKAAFRLSDERIEDSMGRIQKLEFVVSDGSTERSAREETVERTILFVGEPAENDRLRDLFGDAQWRAVSSAEEACREFAERSGVAFALLDLEFRPPAASLPAGESDGKRNDAWSTLAYFDFAPLEARSFAHGQKIMRELRDRLPDLPIYIVSRGEQDDELLLAAMQSGGCRGTLTIPDESGRRSELSHPPQTEAFRDEIRTILDRTALLARIDDLQRRNRIVEFDVVAKPFQGDETRLRIECRDFRESIAPRAQDVGLLLSDHERPQDRFDDVVGAALARQYLDRARNWLRDAPTLSARGVKAPRGVLLWGPPGTGKTKLARALAGESEGAFFLVQAATLKSNPAKVQEVFRAARRNAPSVIFIDELESFGLSREFGNADPALNQILTEMDGFAAGAAVIVVGATNHPRHLDPALRRRFSHDVLVELPNRDERRDFVRRMLERRNDHDGHRVSETLIDRIANESEGGSLATLETILEEAVRLAVEDKRPVDDEILERAFEEMTYGQAKQAFGEESTAWHEAGHIVAMHHLGKRIPNFVTIVARGDYRGFAVHDHDRGIRTRSDYENEICIFLAGRVAQEKKLGEEGVEDGAWEDLEHASALARHMAHVLGMTDEIGLVSFAERQPEPHSAAQAAKAVRRSLDEQEKRTRELLDEHFEELERVAGALLEKKRLYKTDLEQLLGKEPKTDASHAS
jgi:cell division protease FtsH